jgi:hypothetical protein
LVIGRASPIAGQTDADEQRSSRAYLDDVLEHVLDKGIVVDAWLRLSLIGVSLITVEARVLVASIETSLKHATVVNHLARPALPEHSPAPPCGRPPRHIGRKKILA